MVHAIENLLAMLIHISVPAFAIASMLSMGLRTPLRTFTRQLRDRRTVLAVLGANFVVIPAVGTVIVWLTDPLMPFHAGEGFVIALCAAGAPFVLQLGAMAKIPYGEIAGRLFLSEGTVRNHVSAAIGKLGVANRAEAVRTASDNGWI